MDLIEGDNPDAEFHWYFVHKIRVINRALSRLFLKPFTIVDIGAGTGYIARKIIEQNDIQHCYCVDINYSDKELSGCDPKISYHLQFTSEMKADVFLLLDVIEHVEMDIAFLNSITNNIQDSAFVIITVPAFQFLWSNHDTKLKHYRRYNKKQLVHVAQKSGLEILECRYLYTTIFPLVAIKKLFDKKMNNSNNLKKQNRILQNLILGILNLDQYKITKNWPGTSLLLIAKFK